MSGEAWEFLGGGKTGQDLLDEGVGYLGLPGKPGLPARHQKRGARLRAVEGFCAGGGAVLSLECSASLSLLHVSFSLPTELTRVPELSYPDNHYFLTSGLSMAKFRVRGDSWVSFVSIEKARDTLLTLQSPPPGDS